jgi:predicted DNA-binding transcriptional regulator AlpA
MTKRIVRTPAAAEYVGLSAATLEKKRLQGGGPRFIRLGRRAIGYDVRDLDAWLDGCRGNSAATLTNTASK